MRILILLSAVLMASCTTTKIEPDHKLQEAKEHYTQIVSLQQETEAEPLFRTDWPSCSDTALENMHRHPVAWTGYVLYHLPVSYAKEYFLMGISPLLELGNLCLNRPTNQLQNKIDDSYYQNYVISYPEMYYKFWTESKHATHMNMDKYDTKKLDYAVDTP